MKKTNIAQCYVVLRPKKVLYFFVKHINFTTDNNWMYTEDPL